MKSVILEAKNKCLVQKILKKIDSNHNIAYPILNNKNKGNEIFLIAPSP